MVLATSGCDDRYGWNPDAKSAAEVVLVVVAIEVTESLANPFLTSISDALTLGKVGAIGSVVEVMPGKAGDVKDGRLSVPMGGVGGATLAKSVVGGVTAFLAKLLKAAAKDEFLGDPGCCEAP